MLETEMHPVV